MRRNRRSVGNAVGHVNFHLTRCTLPAEGPHLATWLSHFETTTHLPFLVTIISLVRF